MSPMQIQCWITRITISKIAGLLHVTHGEYIAAKTLLEAGRNWSSANTFARADTLSALSTAGC
jgi:hypothetical protein